LAVLVVDLNRVYCLFGFLNLTRVLAVWIFEFNACTGGLDFTRMGYLIYARTGYLNFLRVCWLDLREHWY